MAVNVSILPEAHEISELSPDECAISKSLPLLAVVRRISQVYFRFAIVLPTTSRN